MNFGEYIKTNRDARNLTQLELAEMIGVSNTTISNYETGTSTPSFSCMLKLFSLFGSPFYADEDSSSAFSKQLTEVFSKTELKNCFSSLSVLQAGNTLCCSGIEPDDFLFVAPFDTEPAVGERVYYKSDIQSGIYKLYHHKSTYILMPENQHSVTPLQVDTLKDYVFEIKAVLHITAHK